MTKVFSLAILLAAVLVAGAGAQSLADIAAQTKTRQKNTPNVHLIDNDILPSVSDPSAYSSPYETKKESDKDNDKDADASDKDKEKDKDKDKKEAGKKDDKDKKDDKKTDALKKQVEAQQKEVATLQRELDIAQREARVHAAEYYADAANKLRDEGKFMEDGRKSQTEIDAKTQALADAKQKLDELQEQARKAGLPPSETENSQNAQNSQ
jgi:hypothetical protein